MVAPTELTTSAPYARYSLTRLKEILAVTYWGAKSFSSLSSEQQTRLLELMDDGSDYIASKCFGNQGFYRRTIAAGLTLVDGQGTYEMPSDCKRLEVLTEVIGGQTREIPWIDEHGYTLLWGRTLTTTHPIAGSQSSPRYTHRGFSTDQKLIIERIPAPSSVEAGGKLYPLYTPYDEKFSNDGDVILVPAARRAQVAYCKMIMAADAGNNEQYVLWDRELTKECDVLQNHEGRVTGEPDTVGVDETFITEIQDP